ncbi:MAG TPA: hypothetical protein VGM54_24615 [Chthoniobacter sp.]|jgi:hypothetical protein
MFSSISTLRKSRNSSFQSHRSSCRTAFAAVLAATALISPGVLLGHGFEGDRFFPPTIQTDDPFATDELSLPNLSIFNNPAGDGSPKTREIDISSEFDKEIFPGFALGITGQYSVLQPKGAPSVSGWDNISVSAKYQLLQVPAHEFIFSVGVEWEIGGSGRYSLVNNYSTISPNIYFGKGFGDLPDSLKFFKPLAITGQLAEDFPVRSLDSNVFEWGFAVEYSLPYLEQHVKDTGMVRPFRDMIPLVEFAMQTPENRGGGGTTGTINPGVLWEGRYCQIGAEAMIPVNRQSGPNIGMVFNVQIYIDDIFPKLFGHPIFGGSENSLSSGTSK